jgi:hypothetical protein
VSELSTLGVERLRNGASVVRVQQRVGQVDIHHGELRVLVGADGSLAAVSGTMRPDRGGVAFQSSATAALEAALDALYGPQRARPAIREAAEQAGGIALSVAANPAFDVRVARAKRELWPDGDRLVPVWTVELLSDAIGAGGAIESAGRRYLIGDADGSVVREVDLIANDSFVYRVFADATGNRAPLDGPLQSFNPHPTRAPDGSVPELGPYNLVVMEAFSGPRDPWLGPMATTTSGNNVDAFADITPPNGFNAGDIRPEVRAGRTLRAGSTAAPARRRDRAPPARVSSRRARAAARSLASAAVLRARRAHRSRRRARPRSGPWSAAPAPAAHPRAAAPSTSSSRSMPAPRRAEQVS